MSIEKSAIEDRNKKRDLERQAFLRKQYLPVKIVGLVLIDIVPYEKKQEMIAGLKRLFAPEGDCQPIFQDSVKFNAIPDIRTSGIMSGGRDVALGVILNSDLGEGLLQGIQRNLPFEISRISVSIGQFVDFAYHIAYTCRIKGGISNSIEKTFIESLNWVSYEETNADGQKEKGERSKGPILEPIIQDCQKKIEEYLKPFSSGMFLAPNFSGHCPTLKAYSIASINFKKFDNWRLFHFDLLKFLGFDFLYSRFDNMLVADYRESLIPSKPNSVFQGLVFLASEDMYQNKFYVESGNQILSNLDSLGWEGLSKLLTLYYWSTYNIELTQKKYEEKNSELLTKINCLKTEKQLSVFEVQDSVLEAYNNFNNYRLAETGNLRVAKENSERFALKKLSKYSVPIAKPEINVFYDLYEGSNYFIETENKKLKEIQDDFDSLFQYCTNCVNSTLNKTNLNLQKSMNFMTIVMLILTAVAVALAVALALSPYFSQIWDHFQSIWQVIIPQAGIHLTRDGNSFNR